MRVSLVQCSTEWLQPQNNKVACEGWIKRCGGSELVVFPEMFTTGFCMEPQRCAEGGGETLNWMVGMARKYNISIAGSVAVEDGGSYYNRVYFVNRDGSYSKYDKRHLFSFAGEDKYYTAGRERVIVELNGVRILLLICYDIRFPVWSRICDDYDMILCVANWPESRRIAWETLLRARAIENLCYVGGVNIVGEGYFGGTTAVNYYGCVIEQVADGECGVLSFDIDIEALSRFRERFPALEDGDKFEIK